MTFQVGDMVTVSKWRGTVTHTGRIWRVTQGVSGPLYWVEGLEMARDASVLTLVQKAVA